MILGRTMGLIDLASVTILWRGMAYYEEGNRIKNKKELSKNIIEADVLGSEQQVYHVHMELDHPRRSTCTCPFALGRRVICKHMVALYFTHFPEEVNRIQKEAQSYEEEENERRKEAYEQMRQYVNTLSKAELRKRLLAYMVEEQERRYY